MILADAYTIDVLSSYIDRFHFLITIQGSADSWEEGQKLVNLYKPAIVYIEGKILSQCNAELHVLKKQCFFVVLSERDLEYKIVKNFAFDCLIKPLQFLHFANSIKKYGAYLYHLTMNEFAILDSEMNCVKVKDRNLNQIIKYSDLLHIQAMENYVKYHMVNGEFYVKKVTMAAALLELPAESFSRVHKSHVVNDYLITSINGNYIYMKGVKIPIGEAHRVVFFAKAHIKQIRSKREKKTISM